MRIILGFLKWILIALLLAIGLLLALPWVPVAQDQFGRKPYDDYLAGVAQPLDMTRADGNFALAEADYNAQFIMLSEIHGYAGPQDLDLALLTHLHRKADTRLYLAEISPAMAIAFNDYVAGGQASEVEAIFDRWARKNLQWANHEFFGKLTKIRSLNAALPQGQRIWFIGIDGLDDTSFAERMIGKTSIIAQSPGLDSFDGVQLINADLASNALSREKPVSRYTHFLDNIERVLSFPGAKNQTFYGLWGLFHGSKVPVNKAKPLAMRLNEAGGLMEGRVVTLVAQCVVDCFNMMPAIALPAPMHGPDGQAYTLVPMRMDFAMLWRLRGIDAAKKAAGDAQYTLFHLDDDNSPYLSGSHLVKSTGYLAMIQRFAYEGSAGEATDYMLLMQGNPALTPWKGEAYDISGKAKKYPNKN